MVVRGSSYELLADVDPNKSCRRRLKCEGPGGCLAARCVESPPFARLLPSTESVTKFIAYSIGISRRRFDLKDAGTSVPGVFEPLLSLLVHNSYLKERSYLTLVWQTKAMIGTGDAGGCGGNTRGRASELSAGRGASAFLLPLIVQLGSLLQSPPSPVHPRRPPKALSSSGRRFVASEDRSPHLDASTNLNAQPAHARRDLVFLVRRPGAI